MISHHSRMGWKGHFKILRIMLTQDETCIMDNSESINNLNLGVKNLPTKKTQDSNGSTDESCQTLKKLPNLHKHFKKIQ